MGSRTWLLICTIALAADAARAQQDARGDQSKALEGRWIVELTLDPGSIRSASPVREAKGHIAFGTSSWWGNTDRFGRHDVDTRPFFGRTLARPLDISSFGPADTSMVTEVSGSLSRDSVSVDFIPRLDRWGITLRGRFFGDSALGRWYRRGTDGSGVFVLRRVSKEAVSVAAIPVPKRAAPVAIVSSAAKTPARGGRRPAGMEAKKTPGTAVATTTSGTAATPVPNAAARAPATAPQATPASTPATASATASATTPATARATAAGPAPVRAAGAPRSAAPVNPSVPMVSVVANRALGPTGAAAATGALRVRMYDRASKQWFVTKYALQLPDKRWMYGNLRSGTGPEGWGRVVAGRDPGRYVLEVTDFVCGDKLWFLASKIVQPVQINAGETTDVTIEADLTALQAKKSIDNRTGARCAAAPGVPR